MSDDTAALVPIEEKTVDFYGDSITAALVEVGSQEEIYVPLRPLCDYLGVDWSGQRKRLNRDEVLAEAQGVVIMSTPGGQQQFVCLPLKFIPGWLFGIDTSRLKPELKEKIIRYRRECYDVLWKAFQAQVLDTVDTRSNSNIAALIQIREMGKAITRMAEQQIEIEQRLDTHEARLNRAAQVVGQLQREMKEVKRLVQPGATISEAQASVISTAVKALGEYMASKEPGKNPYQSIFSELYRRFRVTEYHNIRQEDYLTVLAFLDEWHKAAGGGGISIQDTMNLDN